MKSLKHLKGNEHRGRGAQLERNLEKENFRPPSSRIAAENGICQTSAAALAYKLTYTYTHSHIGSMYESSRGVRMQCEEFHGSVSARVAEGPVKRIHWIPLRRGEFVLGSARG